MTDQATDQPAEGVIVQPSTELVNATAARELMAAMYDPDMDFRAAALDAAYTTHGFRLVKKEELEGVPFIVKRIVFREGYPRKGMKGDYVSVECIVADQDILEDPIISRHIAQPISVYGNEAVIFNDSGTGVRRSLTMMCETHGLINVGKLVDGENPYDRQYQLWESGGDLAQDGFRAEDFGHKAIVRALRGLRVSEYDHPEFGPATTWYFG